MCGVWGALVGVGRAGRSGGGLWQSGESRKGRAGWSGVRGSGRSGARGRWWE